MDIKLFSEKFYSDYMILSGKKRGPITFAVKNNISFIIDLNKNKKFSLSEILCVINSAGGKSLNISYKAFYAAVSRYGDIQIKDNDEKININNSMKVSAHENQLKMSKPKEVESSEDNLPEAWKEILIRHPTIKAISLHKAIESGLPIEKAQSASQEGTKQLLEVLNKYRSKIPFKSKVDPKIHAHENQMSETEDVESDGELSRGWLLVLEDHPVMKKETILRAINNGLTLEEAQAANAQGIRKFAEVVNRYCMRKLC